mmetsp:Transcript_22682/g.63283  ORF Transcript_22682/g.63283 Transcript_22682/m.63283 type:complete len:233 (-) Transcript_22682:14-712(-)
MDEERAGEIAADRIAQLMHSKHGYEDVEDVRCCCHLLHKDASKMLAPKDFEQLEAFDMDGFRRTLVAFRDHIVEQYGTVDEAYEAFELRRPPQGKLLRPSTTESFTSAGSQARKPGKGVDMTDFIKTCRKCGFESPAPYDVRVLFNYLDIARVGRATRAEFGIVGMLNAAQELREVGAKVRGAIAAIGQFATRRLHGAGVQAEFEGGDDGTADPSRWAALFQELRTAIHQDD